MVSIAIQARSREPGLSLDPTTWKHSIRNQHVHGGPCPNRGASRPLRHRRRGVGPNRHSAASMRATSIRRAPSPPHWSSTLVVKYFQYMISISRRATVCISPASSVYCFCIDGHSLGSSWSAGQRRKTHSAFGAVHLGRARRRVVESGQAGLASSSRDWATGRRQSGRSDLLLGFLGLSHAADPARAVLGFAREWGVLELCSRHDLPAMHLPLPGEPRDSRRCEPPRDEGSEPIELWIELCRRARAALNIAADLRLGLHLAGSRDDWASLGILDPSSAVWEPWGPDVSDVVPLEGDASGPRIGLPAQAQFWLNHSLQEWLDQAAVGPRINFGTSTPIAFAGEGLFAELALQLVFAATRTSGFAVCTACSLTYIPSRKPAAPPRRHYCPDCREAKVPQRDAAADSRRR